MSELKKAIKSLKRELEKLPSQDKPFAYEALGEVQEECDKMREALEAFVKFAEKRLPPEYYPELIVDFAREALKEEDEL